MAFIGYCILMLVSVLNKDGIEFEAWFAVCLVLLCGLAIAGDVRRMIK